MVGDFNTNLAVPEGRERYKEIEAAMVEEGVEDMICHLLPRKNRG